MLRIPRGKHSTGYAPHILRAFPAAGHLPTTRELVWGIWIPFLSFVCMNHPLAPLVRDTERAEFVISFSFLLTPEE